MSSVEKEQIKTFATGFYNNIQILLELGISSGQIRGIRLVNDYRKLQIEKKKILQERLLKDEQSEFAKDEEEFKRLAAEGTAGHPA